MHTNSRAICVSSALSISIIVFAKRYSNIFVLKLNKQTNRRNDLEKQLKDTAKKKDGNKAHNAVELTFHLGFIKSRHTSDYAD